jgi:hypothetical protein
LTGPHEKEESVVVPAGIPAGTYNLNVAVLSEDGKTARWYGRRILAFGDVILSDCRIVLVRTDRGIAAVLGIDDVVVVRSGDAVLEMRFHFCPGTHSWRLPEPAATRGQDPTSGGQADQDPVKYTSASADNTTEESVISRKSCRKH